MIMKLGLDAGLLSTIILREEGTSLILCFGRACTSYAGSEQVAGLTKASGFLDQFLEMWNNR